MQYVILITGKMHSIRMWIVPTLAGIPWLVM